ncbi:MAG: DUF952 domain-containing protein [Chloroflexota bacterium]|nr:DUF952 domain-containing protein [Chloroflexota bacterium]
MTPTDYIVHICPRTDWQQAQKQGLYQAASLETEGLIHCSRPDQAAAVANRFYANIPNLLLLWIDSQKVTAEIRWEMVDEDEFPHIYGPLNIDAVAAACDFTPDDTGHYRTEMINL